MIISLDTETTGVDFHHGARPFFVTTCTDEGEVRYWEWPVDPESRVPMIQTDDLYEIQSLIAEADAVVLQNAKFDVAALHYAGMMGDATGGLHWPWHKTYDTLLAGHLLHSNQPKDLTSLISRWLRIDISRYETALAEVCNEARRRARTSYPTWRLAKKDDPMMPSLGETPWKYDMWLPATLARVENLGDDHPYRTALANYSNADSEGTIALWPVMRAEIERRGLWKIYEHRLKLLPIAYQMERCGLTVSGPRLDELVAKYGEDVERMGCELIEIAAKYGHELKLPKGAAVNNSLREFVSDKLCLPPIYDPKSNSGNPTLNKDALQIYVDTTDPKTDQWKVANNLLQKRSRDSALQYLESYKSFWRCLANPEQDPTGVWETDNHPTHMEFINRIRANPNDNAPRLVYADWLQERGQEGKAQQIRAWVTCRQWYRLHPNINPTGTDTLRWSSQNPNGQNISKKESFNLRHCIGPEPGREYWSIDAKNIELRIPAFEAHEEDMMRVFLDPGPPYYGSYHLLIFDLLHPGLFKQHGKDCKDLYEATFYQWVKNGNFGVQYGAQEATADRTYHVKGAFKLIKSRFKKVSALNDRMIAFANKHGYVETIPDKSVDPKRGYLIMCSRTERGQISPTVPLCYHTSGTAMQWMGQAMIRTQGQLDQWNKEGWDGRMAFQVHDELLFEFPKAAHPKVNPRKSNLGRIRVIQRLMEQGGDDIGIPTPCTVEYHETSWAKGLPV